MASRSICIVALAMISILSHAQSSLTGSLQMNTNVFLKDESIGAANTPQYESEIIGGELWLDLLYNHKGYEVGLRFDVFENSNLLNPNDSYSDLGIGKLFLRKQFKSTLVELGSIYQQIGSGIIFKSYEERPLLIDNALIGAHLHQSLFSDWSIRLMGGKQKNLFNFYDSWLFGGSVEGFVSLGKNVILLPGAGVLVKRYDDRQIESLISSVQGYSPLDSVTLYRNVIASTFFNTLSWGGFSWYSEVAFKQYDVYFDPDLVRQGFGSEGLIGGFDDENGLVIYNSLSLGVNSFGLSLEWKRTENFVLRSDPFVELNRGLVSFLPPMSRINSFRLKSRYVPATQEIGENAFQMDLRYSFSKKLQMNQYFSLIKTLDGDPLYKEFDLEMTFKQKRDYQVKGGVQLQEYNQGIYEGKGAVPLVKTVIPYVEYLKRWDRTKSVRVEMQLLRTKEDFGSWMFALIEFAKAPHWSISASDMYNYDPKKTGKIHYPRFDVTYIKKQHRLSLSYVKQVEGVVCAGGICRLEPAFSGFRLSLQSNF